MTIRNLRSGGFFRPTSTIPVLLILALPAIASALTIPFSGMNADGDPVSATADFTLGAGTATVKLTNLTAPTHDAADLFTGLDFMLGGLTPSMNTSTGDTGIQRTVDGSGGFTDTGSAQNLSWSLVSLGGGTFQLNFNPDAKDAIIGPPTSGNYSGANGSIKGNPGHTPFAAEMASFVLTVPGLTAATPVTVKTWRFGTELKPATMVPEPTSLLLLSMGLALASVIRRQWGR